MEGGREHLPLQNRPYLRGRQVKLTTPARELPDLPPELRWREWMRRIEAGLVDPLQNRSAIKSLSPSTTRRYALLGASCW